MKTRFIPSQRIKGSDKELFIINYDGSTIELQRTSNLYEPLVVRLNGELLDTIPSKQNKEIEFTTPYGKHILQVWNERVENNLIPKAFVKDGIAAVIDGVPVQNTLADPVSRFKTGKIFIWLLTALLFVKAFIIPLTSNNLSLEGETRVFLFVNIILFIISLSAALTFQLNPLRSVWMALIVSVLEFADYIVAVVASKDIGIVVILFLVLRLSIIASLIFSLRNLKLILNFSDDEFLNTTEKPLAQKKAKRINIRLKYILIPVISLLILGGLYFVITEIINRSKTPSIERDSSLQFRTDLKLPELIPYRKGDKWGYANKNGKVIVEPKYTEVDFFSDNRFFRVKKNKLVGIIDNQGREAIPCLYKDIEKVQDKDLFIAKDTLGFNGVINTENKIIIPFEYSSLEKHPNRDLYIALKEKWGVIDEKSNIIIPFSYSSLEFCNEFIIASRQLKVAFYYGLLNYDGSVRLDFQSLELEKTEYLKSHLLVGSKEIKIYNPIFSKYESEKYYGIIDKNGKNILPIEYNYLLSMSDGNYIEISKTDYLTYEYKKGAINSDGEIIVPCIYDNIYPSSSDDKYITVQRNDLYGVVNIWSVLVIPTIYYFILSQKQGANYYFAVTDRYKHKMGLLNEGRNIVIPFEYNMIKVSDKYHNWIIISKNGRKGVIDFNNNIIIPTEYFDVLDLSEGCSAVKYVSQDSIAKILESTMITNLGYLEEIHKGLLYGYSMIGGISRNPDYKYKNYTALELSNALSDTLARRNFFELNSKFLGDLGSNYESFCICIIIGNYWSQLPGKWGYFDERGELIIDFIYDDAKSFKDGYAKVKFNNKWGVINRKGQVVIPIKYRDDYYSLSKVDGYDLFEIKRKDEWTIDYVDLNGVEYFEEVK